jgi:hypothetical protein
MKRKPAPSPQTWLDVPQLAERWHLTEDHLRNILRRRLIRTWRTPGGRKILIPLAAIRRLEGETAL